jgi:hypothetical protein
MMDRTGAWECVEALATALLDRKVLSANEVAEIKAARENENRWMEISAEFSADTERMEQ